MSEKMDLSEILGRLLNPLAKNQDGDCPHIEWVLEDHRSPGIGEYKCKISTYRYGEYYNYNTEYNKCNCESYEICKRYKNNQQKGK